jgi:secreted trypsin-like serine protease
MVLLVLLTATATGAPAPTRGAPEARSPYQVLRHAERRRFYGAGGRLRAAIVGGQDAPGGIFPSLAFIVDDLGGGSYELCSGTVIASNVVLTAGHCAEDITTGTQDPANGFAVVTGALDWTDTTTRHVSGVSQTAVYPGFDPTTGHGDAAVLELSTPTTAPAIRSPARARSSSPAPEMRWPAGV